MKIQTLDFVDGARSARGLTVIIDVFRAFSVACYCFDKGIIKIIPVADIDTAMNYTNPEATIIRIGERGGKQVQGFDYGNSPTQVLNASLEGKILIQTTHSGTQGLANAINADEVITGALVNAKAISEYIKQKQPSEVSLVRMGWQANERTDEDDVCAEYLEHLILNKPYDETGIRERLFNSDCAARFKDPNMTWSPFSDFEYCTEINKFNFVLALKQSGEQLPFLQKIIV